MVLVSACAVHENDPMVVSVTFGGAGAVKRLPGGAREPYWYRHGQVLSCPAVAAIYDGIALLRKRCRDYCNHGRVSCSRFAESGCRLSPHGHCVRRRNTIELERHSAMRGDGLSLVQQHHIYSVVTWGGLAEASRETVHGPRTDRDGQNHVKNAYNHDPWVAQPNCHYKTSQCHCHPSSSTHDALGSQNGFPMHCAAALEHGHRIWTQCEMAKGRVSGRYRDDPKAVQPAAVAPGGVGDHHSAKNGAAATQHHLDGSPRRVLGHCHQYYQA